MNTWSTVLSRSTAVMPLRVANALMPFAENSGKAAALQNTLQLGLCFLSSLLVSSMIEQPLLITAIVMLATAPLAVLGYWLARQLFHWRWLMQQPRAWTWMQGQFARMAAQGDVPAQSFYGHLLLFRGQGFGAREEGLRLLRLAAPAGDGKAAYQLGLISLSGDTRQAPDGAEAARWWGMAAKAGHADMDRAERDMRRMEGIINAMTAKERRQPALLTDGKSKASRKRRIAAGAGVQIQDVNRLLNQFGQMQDMMKKMKGGGLFKMMKRMGGMKGLPGMGR